MRTASTDVILGKITESDSITNDSRLTIKQIANLVIGDSISNFRDTHRPPKG